MKPSIYRRIRRRSASYEAANAKKDNKQEQSFFGEATHETFFYPAPVIQRKCEKCEEDDKKVQRQPEKKEEEKKIQKKDDKKEEEKLMKKEEKKEEEKLQKKDAGGNSSAPVTSAYITTISGKGNPLPASAQQFFGTRMGYDFSNVKVHTGKEAAASAREVNAKAYTVGNNIVFNEGRYDTESTEGKKLMAHELMHVVQNYEITAGKIKRQAEQAEPQQEEPPLPDVFFEGEGSSKENPTHYANCAGVSVQGSTTANYSSSFSSAGNQVRSRNCRGCTGTECITSTGTVTSTFTANPSVFLPSPPAGLSACETTAVQNFINTTLSAHEQQHVAAFNAYNGTVTTTYNYTGCVSGLQAHTQAVHDRIDAARRASANAASAALDANGANQFTITCNCP
jgi:hypothetical protein